MDDMFANIGIIFCNPPNSLSAIQQPIDYIMQEGGTIHHATQERLLITDFIFRRKCNPTFANKSWQCYYLGEGAGRYSF